MEDLDFTQANQVIDWFREFAISKGLSPWDDYDLPRNYKEIGLTQEESLQNLYISIKSPINHLNEDIEIQASSLIMGSTNLRTKDPWIAFSLIYSIIIKHEGVKFQKIS